MRRALALVLLLSCASARAQSPESLRTLIAVRYPDVRWVDRATLASWLREPTPPLLLDSRQESEFAVSHLRGARRIDPDHPRSDGLPRDRRLVVYCSVGWRSGSVADALRRAGFRDVFNLEGGVFGWANAGLPVHRGEREVRAVHPYDAVWGRMLRRELHASRP
ncbi:MAG: rhodanese-like domain-containing protein [Sandaracinaceae bacterium]|nr:rhodanese-like domain-containing protein [Sandaracinaceae bacterium]